MILKENRIHSKISVYFNKATTGFNKNVFLTDSAVNQLRVLQTCHKAITCKLARTGKVAPGSPELAEGGRTKVGLGPAGARLEEVASTMS